MRRNWRATAAVLGVLGLAAAVLPATVGAQKVANPGSFQLSATDGSLRIGTLMDLSLEPQPFPQCADGLDNDGDGAIDSGDAQCVPGPAGEVDDSELAPGYQEKVDVTITGTVDGQGNVTIASSDISFPEAYMQIQHPLSGQNALVKAKVEPAGDATGSIDPLTGNAVVDVAFRVKVESASLWGNPLNNNCYIGTVANPVRLNLITGHKPPIGSNGALNGAPYNPNTGGAVLVDNAFAVPGASGCTVPGPFGPVNISSLINQATGLGAGTAAGKNIAVLVGTTTPALGKAVDARFTTSPVLGGAAPLTVTLNAGSSIVVKGPATYSWEFSNGTTATGAVVETTFSTGGAHFARLRVTDGDGDSSERLVTFNLTGDGSTTTTTASTTTTSSSTTTTSSSTTTTSSSTTTTASTTTTTTTSTTQPTTTTTTTQPTTTTTTTTTTPPQPSDDSVSVQLTGAVDYSNQGSGTGDLRVTRDAFGIRSVGGTLQIPGANGDTAQVTVSVQRAWILPLWTGQVRVVDEASGVALTTPVLGSLSGAQATVSGVTNWFLPGQFPNLFRPYTLRWSVTDAG